MLGKELGFSGQIGTFADIRKNSPVSEAVSDARERREVG